VRLSRRIQRPDRPGHGDVPEPADRMRPVDINSLIGKAVCVYFHDAPITVGKLALDNKEHEIYRVGDRTFTATSVLSMKLIPDA
jgi:hypothetical protein